MFIVATATQTMESVAKEKKAGISMDGIFLSKLRSAYNAFEFSYQRNSMDGAC